MLRLSGVSEQLRPDLVPIVKEYLATSGKGIAKEIFPTRPTSKKSHVYGIFGAEQFSQVADDTAARGARANRVDIRLGEGEYSVQKRQLETPIHDDERDDFEAQYGSDIKGEEAKVKAVMGSLAVNREIRVKDKVFNTTKFATNALTVPWSDVANADPVADIAAAHVANRVKGYDCRDLVLNFENFKNLQRNHKILELLKYNYSPLSLTNIPAPDLAQILDVDRILIGNALKNDAGLYATDADLKDIWPGDYAALVRTPYGAEFDQPCLGWGWSYKGAADDAIVDEYREAPIETDFLRATYWQDDVYVEGEYPNGDSLDIASKCIHLFGNVQ